MKKIIITDRTKELVHCIIGIKAGWRNEPIGKRGITHFLEHAIFLGNNNYPFPDEEVGKLGVQLDGRTIPEHTFFNFTSMKGDFKHIFKLLLSLVYFPDFIEEKINKEKNEKIITAVTDDYASNPWDISKGMAENLVFNWDEKLSLGTEEDLEILDIGSLLNWHKRYYHSKNSFVIIFGDIQTEEIEHLIEEAKLPLNGDIPSIFKKDWGKNNISIKNNKIKNVELYYGFNIQEYDISWEIINVILGNYAISELWNNKFTEYTYMVDSHLKWTTTEGGFFLYFGCNKTDDVQKIDRNLKLLLNNFKISNKKFEYAKRIAKLEILKLKESGERGINIFFYKNPYFKYNNYKEMIEEIDMVELEKINFLVDKNLNENNMVISSVGPE